MADDVKKNILTPEEETQSKAVEPIAPDPEEVSEEAAKEAPIGASKKASAKRSKKKKPSEVTKDEEPEEDVEIVTPKLESSIEPSDEEEDEIGLTSKISEDDISEFLGDNNFDFYYAEQANAIDFDNEEGDDLTDGGSNLGDGVDFYQEYSLDDSELKKSEMKNNLRSYIATKKIVRGFVFGTDIKYVKINGAAVSTPVAVCKLRDPYSEYNVYIPFDLFYTKTEEPLINVLIKPFSRQSLDNIKIRALQVYLRAPVPIVLMGYDEEADVFLGSRIEALKLEERHFFSKGRYINGVKHTVESGSVIHNASVLYIDNRNGFIICEVCGIPTIISHNHLSYAFVSSPRKLFKVGDKVNVKIGNVQIVKKKDKAGNIHKHRKLTASIKLVNPINPTLAPLRKHPMGFKGKCLGTVTWINKDPKKFCYHIATVWGWNAIALSKKNFNINEKNSLDKTDQIAVIGDTVAFLPVKKYKEVAIGYITEVYS